MNLVALWVVCHEEVSVVYRLWGSYLVVSKSDVFVGRYVDRMRMENFKAGVGG